MNNAGCHPHELKKKYFNIKILFLAPNTTAHIQPLDLGIIQNFKFSIESYSTLCSLENRRNQRQSQIVEFVSVLTTIRWVDQA